MRMGVIPTNFHLGISYELRENAKANISHNRLFSERFFKDVVLKLFQETDKSNLRIIRISISTSAFTTHSHRALSLLDYEEDKKQHKLTLGTKKLREKYGLDTLRWGSEI